MTSQNYQQKHSQDMSSATRNKPEQSNQTKDQSSRKGSMKSPGARKTDREDEDEE